MNCVNDHGLESIGPLNHQADHTYRIQNGVKQLKMYGDADVTVSVSSVIDEPETVGSASDGVPAFILEFSDLIVTIDRYNLRYK